MQVTAGMEHPQVVFQDLRVAEDRRAPSPQVQEELIGRGAHRHGHQATAQGGGPQQRGHMGPGGGGTITWVPPAPVRRRQTRGATHFHPGFRPVPGWVHRPAEGQPFFLDILHSVGLNIQDPDHQFPRDLEQGVPLRVTDPPGHLATQALHQGGGSIALWLRN